MAPLRIRQSHSFTPSPPRPPKGPYTQPINVTAHISAAVCGELFAGTVGIFIFAVLFWKIGKYIRSLNRHRVLREGKLTTDRFARTWYGWVPSETHKRNKRFLARAFKWILDWLSWESSRTDYSWVWWDPGQEKRKSHLQYRKTSKWIPRHLKSYDPPTADAIWNPGIPIECHGTLTGDVGEAQPSITSIKRDPSELPQVSDLEAVHSSGERSSQEYFTPVEHMGGSQESHRNRDIQSHDPTFPANDQSWFLTSSSQLMYIHKKTSPSRITSLSAPDMAKTTVRSTGSLAIQDKRDTPEADGNIPDAHSQCGYSTRIVNSSRPAGGNQLGKSRLWSAKMQLKANRLPPCVLRDSSGPPGTPLVDMLSSLLSEQSDLDSVLIRRESGTDNQLGPSVNQLPILFEQQKEMNKWVPQGTTNKFHTAPASLYRQIFRVSGDEQHPDRSYQHLGAARRTRAQFSPRVEGQSFSQNDIAAPSQTDGPADDGGLCDWEIKLIDGLNRKLLWIFNETTPGQKPYHFAQLANHWLNRETWLVIDPVSRVPIDSRREWGDPRFNVPYPEPTHSPKPKYQVVSPERAYNPRIDSWRATVNKQRRISGLRDAVRTVELYENSLEEPPDGHIDPGSWMFPRPPQGFEVSTKQKNGWYEGGSGWQETFEDWQRVRRGYRFRKLIQGGHVNRNWVKGVASRVHQCCRSTSLKLISKDTQQTPTASLTIH